MWYVVPHAIKMYGEIMAYNINLKSEEKKTLLTYFGRFTRKHFYFERIYHILYMLCKSSPPKAVR